MPLHLTPQLGDPELLQLVNQGVIAVDGGESAEEIVVPLLTVGRTVHGGGAKVMVVVRGGGGSFLEFRGDGVPALRAVTTHRAR